MQSPRNLSYRHCFNSGKHNILVVSNYYQIHMVSNYLSNYYQIHNMVSNYLSNYHHINLDSPSRSVS